MGFITWIASGLLILHTAHSYILLTANLDDVKTLAKQLIKSPVAHELGKIWRRASSEFHKQYRKEMNARAQKRNNDNINDLKTEGRSQIRNNYNDNSNEHYIMNIGGKEQRRHNEHENDLDSEAAKDQSRNEDRDEEKNSDEKVVERRHQLGDEDDLVALGKTASVYLNSIKKIFEQL